MSTANLALCLVLIVGFVLLKRKRRSRLKPFEYSTSVSINENQIGSKILETSPEKWIIIIILVYTIPSLIYFVSGTLLEYDLGRNIGLGLEIFEHLIFLCAALAIKSEKWRKPLLSLVCIQIGIFVYYNFIL